MDGKSAFLMGDLDEKVYMMHFEGFEEARKENWIPKLVKTLHVLK
jgi:hypothetical protein